jgi:hypothetical protein
MKNLVIVMAGDHSLHPAFAENRDFELWVVYFGDKDEVFETYKAGCDRAFRAKGLKIELIRRVLLEHLFFKQNFDFSAYDYILLPDDDIKFPNDAADISNLFKAAADIHADIFQPGIQNDFYSPGWESTKAIPNVFCHRVNIVEVMMFGFSGAAFTRAFLPAIHAMEFMRSGWGIEPIWKKIGEACFRRALNSFVIDAIPAIHTKPIGGGSPEIHAIGVTEAAFIPQIHSNRMKTMAVYASAKDVEQAPMTPAFAPNFPNEVLKQILAMGVSNVASEKP